MDPKITAAVTAFKSIMLGGIPIMLQQNDTAFLSCLCVCIATDALSAYRYRSENVGQRYEDFIRGYFPAQFAPHTRNLYLFRCRALHNFSPAHFSVVYARPAEHLTPSPIGDFYLDAGSFFDGMKNAAEKYFAELTTQSALQQDMLARLNDTGRGGAIAF